MLKLGIDRLSLFDTVPARASDLAAKLAKDFGDGRIAAVHDLPPAMAQADGLVHATPTGTRERSEEHTSELQSQSNLVCRLLLEKKKKRPSTAHIQNHNQHTTGIVICRLRNTDVVVSTVYFFVHITTVAYTCIIIRTCTRTT